MNKTERILIGKITSAVGLKGEFKVYSYAETPDRFQTLSKVYLDGTEYKLEHVRMAGNMVVLKVEGISDRNQAEKLRGQTVEMDESDLPPLTDGSFYIRDILGFVVKTEDGEEVGVLTDVLTDRPQDILLIKTKDNREVMIPMVAEFVGEIHMDEKVIDVHLIDGMLD